MNFIREIWRSVCLMGFAAKLYRDATGNLYLLEFDRSSSKPPRRAWQFPSTESLEMAMRVRCLTASLAAIASAILAIGWAYIPTPAAVVFTILTGVAFWLTDRVAPTTADVCVEVSEPTILALDLTKASDAARLRFVTLVRITAVVVGLICFFSGAGFGVGFEFSHSSPTEWQSYVLPGYLSFVGIWACLGLVISGGWVLNPDHRPAAQPPS